MKATDEQLDALAIPWSGGEQPVKDDVLVYVKMRGFVWSEPAVRASAFYWGSMGNGADIVAYVPACTVPSNTDGANDAPDLAAQVELLRVLAEDLAKYVRKRPSHWPTI